MTIKGTIGFCEGGVESATYGPGQQQYFIDDANELGLVLGTITSDYISVRTADGLITGEFSSKHGGQLAWSK